MKDRVFLKPRLLSRTDSRTDELTYGRDAEPLAQDAFGMLHGWSYVPTQGDLSYIRHRGGRTEIFRSAFIFGLFFFKKNTFSRVKFTSDFLIAAMAQTSVTENVQELRD
ncbi:hypothetical protein CEXT_267811 [Caerostris extrusa]|uniref:Uncharacterized protein n=1 Tax=Caerostris extrusa TaxID=172846 RepID=A0AAV4V3T1_CAEEX|nr:hypothetical protein CEXT_267811 [Caerostris extrusa]